MSKNAKEHRNASGHAAYKASLRKLQIELVKVQRHVIKHGHKVLVIFEGRDSSGKDGTIKRIVQHLSPRETRVVALGKPSDKDRVSWYFQRYAPYLPAAQELVLFNRSWYNRAGVEHVMEFCTLCRLVPDCGAGRAGSDRTARRLGEANSNIPQCKHAPGDTVCTENLIRVDEVFGTYICARQYRAVVLRSGPCS